MSLEELEKEQLDKITHYKLHETELITLSRYVQRKEVKARVEKNPVCGTYGGLFRLPLLCPTGRLAE